MQRCLLQQDSDGVNGVSASSATPQRAAAVSFGAAGGSVQQQPCLGLMCLIAAEVRCEHQQGSKTFKSITSVPNSQ
jgi:hypothetical protein